MQSTSIGLPRRWHRQRSEHFPNSYLLTTTKLTWRFRGLWKKQTESTRTQWRRSLTHGKSSRLCMSVRSYSTSQSLTTETSLAIKNSKNTRKAPSVLLNQIWARGWRSARGGRFSMRRSRLSRLDSQCRITLGCSIRRDSRRFMPPKLPMESRTSMRPITTALQHMTSLRLTTSSAQATKPSLQCLVTDQPDLHRQWSFTNPEKASLWLPCQSRAMFWVPKPLRPFSTGSLRCSWCQCTANDSAQLESPRSLILFLTKIWARACQQSKKIGGLPTKFTRLRRN